MRRYEIEDRTRRLQPIFGAGKWLLWEVRTYPFPHRAYAGTFDTRAEALASRDARTAPEARPPQ